MLRNHQFKRLFTHFIQNSDEAVVSMSGGLLGRTTLTNLRNRWISRKPLNNSLNLNSTRQFSVSISKNMKLLQYTSGRSPFDVRVGYLDGNNVVDINKADPSLSTTLLQVLQNNQLQKIIQLSKEVKKQPTIPLSEVQLVAPITGMDKVLCVGLNYKDHCEEQNLTPPPVPMIFNKYPSCVVGPSQPVKLRTNITKKVDWEVELVVVIGKKASSIKAAQAYDYVAGYTIAQDISARDWQKEKNAGQFLLGKAMDTFCPIGPWITTTDEIPDPETLAISCSLNGVLKQKSKTDQLVHKIPDILERLTSVMTLLPGDIILTGTPGGVGMYRSPPEYLKPGDVITNEIEKIGVLEVKIEEFVEC